MSELSRPGGRVRVVPFSERHLTAAYVAWLNDPEAMRYSENRHRKHTLESCRGYWESFAGPPHFFWAIETETLGHIGNINAYLDLPNRTADVGILIGHRESWGHGFGLEAWMLVAQYLFEVQGIRKLTAGTAANNIGMIKIMERAGMQADGRRVRQLVIEGAEVDVVYAAIFDEDWPQVWRSWIE